MIEIEEEMCHSEILANNSAKSTPNYCITSPDTKKENHYITPAKTITRVRNPFEQAMVDRLHLPIIGSPSLFQIPPQTPQMSSTTFEWTIDEVSSLKPVHVEPHETQFHDSPDSEFEAKAQSAISSYFKDQIIAPSPIDCPLRKQRIILSELNGVTPVGKQNSFFNSSRHPHSMRNAQSQTKLSLPPILPPELERMLSAYMQPHLIQSTSSTPTSLQNDETQPSWRRSNFQTATEAAAKDISLRRKLFDKHNIVLLDNNSAAMPTNSSPTGNLDQQRMTIAGTLSDSLDKSSICSLSPISATGGFSSPDDVPATNKTRLFKEECGIKRKAPDFLQKLQNIEDLSPILRLTPSKRRDFIEAKRQKISYKFRLSEYRVLEEISDISAISDMDDNEEIETSLMQNKEYDDNLSINMKVKDLLTVEDKRREVIGAVTQDQENNSNCSYQSLDSNHSCTPRSAKRGITNCKNLSQSFSNFLEDEDDVNEKEPSDSLALDITMGKLDTTKDVMQISTEGKENFNISTLKTESVKDCCSTPQKRKCEENVKAKQLSSLLTGCDSGFNENVHVLKATALQFT